MLENKSKERKAQKRLDNLYFSASNASETSLLLSSTPMMIDAHPRDTVGFKTDEKLQNSAESAISPRLVTRAAASRRHLGTFPPGREIN